jgi:hypothetical protein
MRSDERIIKGCRDRLRWSSARMMLRQPPDGSAARHGRTSSDIAPRPVPRRALHTLVIRPSLKEGGPQKPAAIDSHGAPFDFHSVHQLAANGIAPLSRECQDWVSSGGFTLSPKGRDCYLDVWFTWFGSRSRGNAHVENRRLVEVARPRARSCAARLNHFNVLQIDEFDLLHQYSLFALRVAEVR